MLLKKQRLEIIHLHFLWINNSNLIKDYLILIHIQTRNSIINKKDQDLEKWIPGRIQLIHSNNTIVIQLKRTKIIPQNHKEATRILKIIQNKNNTVSNSRNRLGDMIIKRSLITKDLMKKSSQVSCLNSAKLLTWNSGI